MIFYSCGFKQWDTFSCSNDMRLKTFKVRRQQFLSESFGDTVKCPARCALFIWSKYQPVCFLTHVIRGVAFTQNCHFRIAAAVIFDQFRNRSSDNELMFNRYNRQFKSYHASCLSCVISSTRHYNFTCYVTFVCTYNPFIIRFL